MKTSRLLLYGIATCILAIVLPLLLRHPPPRQENWKADELPQAFPVQASDAQAPVKDGQPDATRKLQTDDASPHVRNPSVSPAPSWAVGYGKEFWRNPGNSAASGSHTRSSGASLPAEIDLGDLMDRISHALRKDHPHTSPYLEADNYHASFEPEGLRMRLRAPADKAKDAAEAELKFRTVAVSQNDEKFQNVDELALDWLVSGNTAQRLCIESAGLVEHFETRKHGVEVTWVLTRPPRAAGDLLIEAELEGLMFAGASSNGQHFADGSGVARLRVGPVLLADSKGQTQELPVQVEGEHLLVRVPNAFLEQASFPVAIDPTLTPEFGMDNPLVVPASGNLQEPAVAWGSSNYFVVWSGVPGSIYSIRGARVSASGQVLDPFGLQLVRSTNSQYSPAVSWDGTNYFVVWRENHIYGARVAPSGIVVDTNGFAISSTDFSQGYPSVAWNGTNYLVAWSQYATNFTLDVYGARVSPGGTVLDSGGFPITVATNNQDYVKVASDGTNFLVVWDDARVSTNHDIRGARVSGSGVVLDGSSLAISTASGWQQYPAVAWNGSRYLVAWEDSRNQLATDIYGARIDGAGNVLDASGIPICTVTNYQYGPAVGSDGTNFLVVWRDFRAYTNSALYGTRINGAGSVLDPGGVQIQASAGLSMVLVWTGTNYLIVWVGSVASNTEIYGARLNASGVSLDGAGFVVSTAANSQALPAAVWTGTNYLVVWSDSRLLTNAGLYGVRLTGEGMVLDPAGIAINVLSNASSYSLAWNGTNALVVWQDSRSAYGDYDIYAARITGNGIVLDTNGFAICTATNNQQSPVVVWGRTNYLVVWEDYRLATDYQYPTSHIYAARVTGSGTVLDPAGIAVCPTPNKKIKPALASDGTNFFVVWEDYLNFRDYSYLNDIYATRLDGAGNILHPVGIPVCTNAATQQAPKAAWGGTNYLVVWQDGRNPSQVNVYGARLTSNGLPLDGSGLRLSTGYIDALPSLASDGSKYLVAWVTVPASDSYDIAAARISPDGAILNPVPFPITTNGLFNLYPAVISSNPRGFLVLYNQVDYALASWRIKGKIVIENNPPVANNQTVLTGRQTPVAITLTGSDPEGTSLNFSVTTLPTNGQLSGVAPNLVYAPQTNFIGADGFTFKANDGALVSADATVTINVSPIQITSQPQSQTVGAGASLMLSVQANGTAGLTYQWQFNGTNIAGAIGSSLTLTNFSLSQAGLYSVVVSQGTNSLPSARAILTFLGLKMYAGLTLGGPAGSHYLVEYLEAVGDTNWMTLTNFLLPFSPFLLVDPASADLPKRFYRATLLP